MERVALQSRTELLELEFLTPTLTANGVVVVARLLTYEEDTIDFSFSFSGHNGLSCQRRALPQDGAWGGGRNSMVRSPTE